MSKGNGKDGTKKGAASPKKEEAAPNTIKCEACGRLIEMREGAYRVAGMVRDGRAVRSVYRCAACLSPIGVERATLQPLGVSVDAATANANLSKGRGSRW